MKTHKFARKPFYVDAVRVSETNIEEVAQWCEGEIKTDSQGLRYIHVTNVHRPLNDKQTQAYLGDWVLLYGSGFKVYIPKAFDKSFEKVKHLTRAQADEAGITVPHEPSKQPERAKKPTPKAMPPKAQGLVHQPFEVKADTPASDAMVEANAVAQAKADGVIDAEEPKKKDEVDELFEEVLRDDPRNAGRS